MKPRIQAPTGIYVGLAEIVGMPPEKPGDKWYHENIVYIRPDSLFLEGNPIVIRKNGEKGYSASDGGFYSFSGRIDTLGGQIMASLLMFSHDYIFPIPKFIIKDEDTATVRRIGLKESVRQGLAVRDSSFFKRTSIIHLTAKGFEMDSVQYVPTAPNSTLGLLGFPDAERFFHKKQ